MVITTRRLRLVQFHEGLITDKYVSWLNNPEVVKYSEQRHRRHTLETCRQFVQSINNQTSFMWGIFLDGSHVGNTVASFDVFNSAGTATILIGETDLWGKGVGGEAWAAVCDWILYRSRLAHAGTMGCNARMLRIFEKYGMQIDGRRPNYFEVDGGFADMVVASKQRPAA